MTKPSSTLSTSSSSRPVPLLALFFLLLLLLLAAAAPASASPSAPASSSLLLHTPLDETAGLLAVDTFGGNDGVLSVDASALSAVGAFRTSAAFDFRGGSETAEISFPGITWTPAQFSVQFWIFPDATAASGDLNVGSYAAGFSFSVDSAAAFSAGRGAADAQHIDAASVVNTLPRDTWSHVTLSYADSDRLAAYVDGELVQYKDIGAVAAWSGFKIGGSSDLSGMLDDFRIYTVGVDAGEARALYRSYFVVQPSVTSLTVAEAPGAGSPFAVALSIAPSTDVTVAVTASPQGLVTATPSSLTFSSANWSDEVSVTMSGVGDLVDTSVDPTASVSFVVTSDDERYDGSSTSDSVDVTVTDDDVQTVVCSSAAMAIDEGSSAELSFLLSAAPGADVTVSLSSADSSLATVSHAELTFSSGNFASAQTVTISAVFNDGVDLASDIAATSISVSADLVAQPAIPVDVVDNDVAGITMSPYSVTAPEGTLATTTLSLSTSPTSLVTLTFSSDDTAIATSTTQLFYSPGNYAVAQTLTVTMVDDDVKQQTQTSTILLPTATSSDGQYNVAFPRDEITAVVDDSDSAAVVLSPSAITAMWSAATTMTMALSTKPLSDVTLEFDLTSVNGAISVSSTTLTFATTNWSDLQTFTATGVSGGDGESLSTRCVSDFVDYSIDWADPAFSDLGFALESTSANNVHISKFYHRISEAGGTATFLYTLTQSTGLLGSVDVSFTSSDTSKVTLSGTTSFTFTVGTWNDVKTVTFTSLDDDEAVSGDDIVTTTVNVSGSFGSLDIPDISVARIDDDVASISTTVTAGTAAENGGVFAVGIDLDTPPTADVTVTVTADDTDEATVTNGALTFTAVDYSDVQSVTLVSVNDNIAHAMDTIATASVAVTSSDAEYAALAVPALSMTATEDDTAGVGVSATTLTMNEFGSAEATFEITLDTDPQTDVTVTLVSADEGEATVSAAELVFSSANYATGQTVTITAVDDNIDLATAPTVVIDTTWFSFNQDYDGASGTDVTVTLVDNDDAGVVLSASSLTIAEGAATGVIDVSLATEPTSLVTVSFAEADSAVCGVTGSPLVFSASNYASVVTVTVSGVSNGIDHPADLTTTVSVTVASDDGQYSSLVPADVDVEITDNDTALLNISPVDFTIAEGTATGLVVLTLDTEPTSIVTVALSSADTAIVGVTGSPVVFSTSNYGTARTVTLSAVEDVIDYASPSTTVDVAVSADDAHYNGLVNSDVDVDVTDNDIAALNLAPTDFTIAEGAATGEIVLTLDTKPTSVVTVSLVSSDSNIVSLSAGSVEFSTSNYGTARTVTLSAVEDTIDYASLAETVAVTIDANDGQYDALVIADVDIEVTDNDVAVLNLSPTAVTIAEGAATGEIVMTLDTKPTSLVTVTFTSADTDEAVLLGNPIVFSTTDFGTAQTITVSSVGDSVDDVADPTTTVGVAVSSDDGQYAALVVGDVDVEVTDDDVAGVDLSPVDVTIAEGAATGELEMTFTSEPTSLVTIAFTVADGALASVAGSPVVFSTSNYATARTVTVSAVEDAIDYASPSTTVGVAVTADDAKYSALVIADVDVDVTDNDVAAVDVPVTSATIIEDSGEIGFGLRLETEPSSLVTLALGTTAAVNISPTSITFSTSNYATMQTFSATAVPNVLSEVPHPVISLTSTASSSDGQYDTLAGTSISLTVTDDDTPGTTVVVPTETVAEDGGTATFGVALESMPSSAITVTSTISTTVSFAQTSAPLTFVAGDWSIFQTVTFSSTDDATDSGLLFNTASVDFAHSSDAVDYDLVVAPGGTVYISEDEAPPAAFTLSGSFDSTVTEADVVSSGFSLTIADVPRATFEAAVGSGGDEDDAIVAAIAAANATSVHPNGFAAQMNDSSIAAAVSVTRVSGTEIRIDFPLMSEYVIWGGNDVLYIVLDSAALELVGVSIDIGIYVEIVDLVPEFTAAAGVTEKQIADGNAALSFTIVHDRFAETLTSSEVDSLLRAIETNGDGDWTDVVAAMTDADLSAVITVAADGASLTVRPVAMDECHIFGQEALDVTFPSFATLGGIETFVENVTQIADTNEPIVSGSVSVAENGGVDTFSVRLTYAPTSDATVELAVDATELVLSSPSLTFTTGDWSTSQVVTATGVDNDVGEGVHRVYIGSTVVSSDTEFVAGLDKTVTVTDDDVEFLVSVLTPATLGEAVDVRGTFAMRLATDIVGSVTVAVTSSAPEQFSVSPSALTFSSATALTLQTVTVDIVDDDAGEGLTSEHVAFVAQTSDVAYDDAPNPAQLDFSIRDDDVGADVAHGSLVIDEGSQTTLSVALVGLPAADVVVHLVPDDGGEDTTISPFDSFTFTAATWSVHQTVEISALVDSDPEWPGEVHFALEMASNDTRFDGFPVDSVTLTTVDAPPLLVVERALDHGASNATAIEMVASNHTDFNLNLAEADTDVVVLYAVSITGPPLAGVDYDVSIESSIPGAVGVAPSTLTFTSGDWNTTQYVSASTLDDDIPENNAIVQISFFFDTSSDQRFGPQISPFGVPVPSAASTITVVDDDVLPLPKIRFRSLPPVNNTVEGDDEAERIFVVELASTPGFSSPIGFSAVVSNDFAASVEPSLVTWESSAWTNGLTLRVRSIDNEYAEGMQNYTATFCMHNFALDGSFLDPINCIAVAMVDVDDDVAQVHAEEPSGSTSEDGSTVSFPVYLESRPHRDVVIGLSVDDEGESVITSDTVLTFGTESWSTAQTVVLRGVNDDDIDGIATVQVTGTVLGGSDADYVGLGFTTFVYNRDDDTVGVQYSLPNGLASEAGGTAQIKVSLSNAFEDESAIVVVTAVSSNENEIVIEPSSHVFGASNWDELQGFVLHGQDDDFDDGNVPVTVTLTNTETGEANDLIVLNHDDDTARLVLSAPPSCRLIELPGTAVSYDLRLNSQPYDSVTVRIASNDTTEGFLSDDRLVFTDQNWSVSQHVIVAAVLDRVTDLDTPFSVTFDPESAGDSKYEALSASVAMCSNANVHWPVVDIIDPATASTKRTTLVTVRGSQFGFEGQVHVSVNGVKMQVLGTASNELLFELPFINSTAKSLSAQTAGAKNPFGALRPPQRDGSMIDYAPEEGYALLAITNDEGGSVTVGRELYLTSNCFDEGEVEDPKTKRCIPCPEGLYCPGGKRAWPIDGWYSLDEYDLEPVRCNPPEACKGGRDSTCAAGYTDNYCANCENGYFREGIVCSPCGGADGVLLTLISSVITVVVLVTMFIVAALVCRDETFTDIIDVVAAIQIVQAAGKMNRGGTPMFILTFYRYLSVVTLDVEFLQPGCSVGSSFMVVFFGSFALMAFVAVIAIGTILTVGWMRASIMKRREGEAAAFSTRAWSRNRLVRVLVLIPVLLYINLTFRSLQAVMCTRSSTGDLVLVADPNIVCYTGDHLLIAPIAWASLLLITAGLPITTGTLLFVRNRQGRLFEPQIKARFGYFYEELRMNSFWFFLVTISTELSLTVCSVIFANKPVEQFVVAGSFLIFFVTVIVTRRPFRKMIENGLAIGVAVVSFFGLAFNLALGLDAEMSDTLLLALSILIFVLVVFILIAAIMLVFNAVALERLRNLVVEHIAKGGRDRKPSVWMRVVFLCVHISGGMQDKIDWEGMRNPVKNPDSYSSYWRKVKHMKVAKDLDVEGDYDSESDSLDFVADGKGPGLRAPLDMSKLTSKARNEVRSQARLHYELATASGIEITLDALERAYEAPSETTSSVDTFIKAAEKLAEDISNKSDSDALASVTTTSAVGKIADAGVISRPGEVIPAEIIQQYPMLRQSSSSGISPPPDRNARMVRQNSSSGLTPPPDRNARMVRQLSNFSASSRSGLFTPHPSSGSEDDLDDVPTLKEYGRRRRASNVSNASIFNIADSNESGATLSPANSPQLFRRSPNSPMAPPRQRRMATGPGARSGARNFGSNRTSPNTSAGTSRSHSVENLRLDPDVIVPDVELDAIAEAFESRTEKKNKEKEKEKEKKEMRASPVDDVTAEQVGLTPIQLSLIYEDDVSDDDLLEILRENNLLSNK